VWYDGRSCPKQKVLSEVFFAVTRALREQGVKLA
jgi:hypothetical protein